MIIRKIIAKQPKGVLGLFGGADDQVFGVLLSWWLLSLCLALIARFGLCESFLVFGRGDSRGKKNWRLRGVGVKRSCLI